MKKIVASVGLVAVGASGLHAATVAGLSEDTTKPWSVGASLRGFYDDNVNGAPSSGEAVKTFGINITPSISVAGGNEQNSGTLSTEFGYNYYDKKVNPSSQEHYDWTLSLN